MTKKKAIASSVDCGQRKKVEGADDLKLEKQIRNCVQDILAEKIQLESYIKSETRAAQMKVTGFIGVILAATALAGFFGWNQIVERVSTNAAAKIADDVALTTAKEFVQTSVLQMISNSVPTMIDKTVPQMIRDSVAKTERNLKEDITKYVENEVVQLANNEESLMALYGNTEEKLSLVPVMAQARAGDRGSYEELIRVAKEKPSLAPFINAAIIEVDAQYQSKKFNHYGYNITLKRQGSKNLELVDYVEIVNADNDWNCDGAINDLVATGRKEFVCSLVRLVKNTKRLDSVYLAISGIEQLTSKAFRPLAIRDVLEWWETAKEKPEYFSPYQAFCDLRREFNDRRMLTTTNKVDYCAFLARFDNLQKRFPNCSAIPEFILAIVAYSPFREEVICSDNNVYKRSLEASEKMPFGKTDKWHCYKALYDAYHGSFYEGINARLEISPSFGEELKKSGLFNSTLFERSDINWTGKSKRDSGLSVSKNGNTLNTRLEAGSPPSNVLGFIKVKILPGKHILPLPFIRDDSIAKECLDTKLTAAKEGDVISWTIDQRIYFYRYDGAKWISENGMVANDVEIPVGQCEISYERVKNEESEMSFAGVISL